MFWKKKNVEEDAELDPEEELAGQVMKSTAEIEAEKTRRREEREQKRLLKEAEAKRKQIERWVAPVLLIITLLISLIVRMMSS